MSHVLDLTQPGAFEGSLFNPYLAEVRADPWPVCRTLREHDRVYESPLGFFMLSGYAESLTTLRDPRFSVDPKSATGISDIVGDQVLGPAQRGLDHMMLFVDPPDHTRLRGLVNKAFTPRMVESMRPRIQGIVDDLLDAVADQWTMDLIGDFAFPLPATVISEMLGIPAEDRTKFRGWARDISPILDPFVPPTNFTAIAEAGMSLVGYFDELIEGRRARPGTDLLSQLIHAEEDGQKLSPEELRATCVLLLIAGHETTMNVIGNGMLALMSNPDELDRLKREPDLMRSAVEELCRHDGPGLLTGRIALEDVELGDKLVKKGRFVLVLIGAANRDPDQFPDPDRLDVARDPNRHLAFSAGPHFCLGATLARVEAQIAIRTLLARLPTVHLDTNQPEWRETVTFRGLKSLPVRWN